MRVSPGVVPYHSMRRKDREIVDAVTIDGILAGGRYATIALVGESPYLVTLSYGYDPELKRLCFHVAHEGKKLERIAADPRGCATVIDDLGYKTGECAHPFRSVVAFGRFRLVSDPADARRAMRTLLMQLERNDDAWGEMRLDDAARFQRFSVLVFEIDACTAKQGQ